MAHTADSKHPTPPADANIEVDDKHNLDYTQRAQWLRAALLGANDGLVSTASLIMGVGAVRQDFKAMVLTGFAGLVAGACSMAIGEFTSVYSQVDVEVAQMKRREEQKKKKITSVDQEEGLEREEEESSDGENERVQQLPRPMQAAMASGLSFSAGAAVPLLAALLVREYKVRLVVVPVTASLALLAFGATGAALGKAPLMRSSLRVLLGGCIAMAITFGLTKLIGYAGLSL